MTKSIWIVNQKGGTGKTTVSAPVVDHLIYSGSAARIIDADTQPEQKKGASLSAIFPAAGRIDIGVAPEELLNKPSLAVAHYDQLFEAAKTDDMLVDFGANVSSSLLYWMEESEIGERLGRAGIHLDIVIITTAHPDAVGDALELVKRLRHLLPKSASRLFVALNQGAGDIDAYANSPEMAEFTALRGAGDIELMLIPKCISEIWRDIEKHRITAFAANAMSSEKLASKLGTPELETSRGRKALGKWHKAVISEFVRCGIVADGAQ